MVVSRSMGDALYAPLVHTHKHKWIQELGDDDHTQYRLESEDHSHQSTGLQGGQLDHGLALTGLGDDDHPQYRLEADDHSHQSTGAQAGQLDHGLAMVAASLLDDDHTQYRLESADHSHQSTGAQAGKLDHGLALDGLGDDDHTQYIKHSLATAADDFLIASGAGAFIKKTLAETQTLIAAGAGTNFAIAAVLGTL